MYKNNTKKTVREKIWKHALNTLVSQRDYSTVITEKDIYLYQEHLKKYLIKQNILDLSSQENVWMNFIDFRKAELGVKHIENLKILFFCGSEPENDIEVLLSLGIKENNIWAVELDKSDFLSAAEILKHSFPSVKLFRTKIENLFEVVTVKFDIVYLDYTAPFFSKQQKPYKTTIELFKNNVLEDFGVLITNYSEINSNDDEFNEYTDLIAEYFNYQTFVHEFTEGDGTFLESPYKNEKDFGSLVKSKYQNGYSSFLSHFHFYLAEVITPSLNVFKNASIKSLLFDENALRKYLNTTEVLDEDKWGISLKELEPSMFWFEHFVENAIEFNPAFSQYLKSNNIVSVVSLVNMLKEPYEYKRLYNKQTLEYLVNTQKKLIDPSGGLFCDIPMLHLWAHLVINQLGAPYHVNLKNHLRFKYTGSKREMYVDVFTLDRCRYFYNWTPSVSSLPESMLNVSNQLIIRSCIDVIRKNTQMYLKDESYQYGNLICYNDDGATFTKEVYLEKRKTLKNKRDEDKIKFVEMFEVADHLAKRVVNNYCASFQSFINFHPTYTYHAFVSLKIVSIPDEFKIFGRLFKKHKIEERFNFTYFSYNKTLDYRCGCSLNGSYAFDLMVIKTVKSIFERYGLICKIIIIQD